MVSFSIFHVVCDLGFEQISEHLIVKGADINYVGKDGYTPLLRALSPTVHNRSTVSIPYLIEHGANVNATNDNGDSALILAAAQSKNQLRKKNKKINEISQTLILENFR